MRKYNGRSNENMFLFLYDIDYDLDNISHSYTIAFSHLNKNIHISHTDKLFYLGKPYKGLIFECDIPFSFHLLSAFIPVIGNIQSFIFVIDKNDLILIYHPGINELDIIVDHFLRKDGYEYILKAR